MATARIALGFKPHTGWTAMLAIAGTPDNIKVLMRCRLELLPQDGSIPKHVYHEAEALSSSKAAELIARARKASEKMALRTLRETLHALESDDVKIAVVGIPAGSATVPDDLAAVLRAHTLVHAAEGVFFRQMVAAACTGLGLKIVTVRERDIWDDAAARYGLKPAVLRERIDGVRKRIGAPWGADQKIATVAALLALKS